MQISRRNALVGAGAAVAVAGVPRACRKLQTVFRQMSDRDRALARDLLRRLASPAWEG